MNAKSHERLRVIRFEGEMLPGWAQLLDVAAGLCPVPDETRRWFSRFASGAGVDDSRTVLDQCEVLRASLQSHRESVLTELRRTPADLQASRIFGGWMYALDTMIQEACVHDTCSWIVEGSPETAADDSDGGDMTLRRV